MKTLSFSFANFIYRLSESLKCVWKFIKIHKKQIGSTNGFMLSVFILCWIS